MIFLRLLGTVRPYCRHVRDVLLVCTPCQGHLSFEQIGHIESAELFGDASRTFWTLGYL